MEEVIQFLDAWEEDAKSQTGLEPEEIAKRCLSKQTSFGWKLTSEKYFLLFIIL